MPELRGRGRPRSAGSHLCARCQQGVAKIRVIWPDGPVCGRCFSVAASEFGICAHCGDHRLLPGRSPTDERLCATCAGITTNLRCDRCGREGERRRRGCCAACIVTEDLTAILHPNDPPDLRLVRLIRELAGVERPASVITWMRSPAARALLEQIGTRELALTHEAFDALPPSPAVEHLRRMLEHHRMLPSRGDPDLVRFEAWLEARLARFVNRPSIHQPLERFGRWHHLNKLRADLPPANMDYATRVAKQEITEAGKFLTWLEDQKGATLSDLRQEHIDDYWSTGPSTRKHTRSFLQHALLTGRRRQLEAKARKPLTSPLAEPDERLSAIAAVMSAQHVVLSTRIAALIFLLYATPVGKLVALRRDAITVTPQGMTIRLGPTPAPIPEAITPLFSDYLTSIASGRGMNKDSEWLFPSTAAGRHIAANTLLIRLRIFGIRPLAAKNAVLFDLTQELDAASLAALLGYAPSTMARHGEKSGTLMGSYPALMNEHPTGWE